MNEHHYQRIDKGTKRDYRALARRQPRSAQGTFVPTDPEKRARIIAETPERIRRGETTTQIAESHGIPPRTLRSWLIGDESVENARGDLIAHELAYQIQEIETATEPLPLARAREAFRAWAWIAERREARLYGQKQEITHTIKPEFTVVLKAEQLVDNQGNQEHTGVMSNIPALPNPQASETVINPATGDPEKP